MRKLVLSLAFLSLTIIAWSQQNPEFFIDPLEVRFLQKTETYDKSQQATLRAQPFWQSFVESHGTWFAHFNEASNLPHRAYGEPIAVGGSTPQERAQSFLSEQLADFNLPLNELVQLPAASGGKYTWVNYEQIHQGLKVLGARAAVKLYGPSVVLFACDVYPIANLSIQPTLSTLAAENAATQQLSNIEFIDNPGELAILPVPSAQGFESHLVYAITVHTRDAVNVPAKYYTLVDAHTGSIIYRENTVRHIDGKPCPKHPVSNPPVMNVTTSVTADVHTLSPYVAAVNEGLPNIYITVAGTNYQANQSGIVDIPVDPGTSAQVRLMGPWSRVYTNGTTPQQTVTLQNGGVISMNSVANIRERSAYYSVQRIHDHMKASMPTFTGMDTQLATNVDEEGTCNAFYDGASINFFNIGGGCNPTSLVSDVVYHEYGHGINDLFYQSQSGSFQNGAMGEGYADFWAISLTDNPVLASGFYTDNENGIRVYNEEPKVYPTDLVGQVHADGEIIMGAWYDTHLLMGANWTNTIELFVDAYAGLQAMTFNGNEGEAYTDVLIDVLQSDDDDGNISNGTPNGNAIVEGFDIHGISLLSNATLTHTGQQFVAGLEELPINANLVLEFPFTNYLQQVECNYRINNGAWEIAPMASNGGNSFAVNIEGQEPATVLSYYLNTRDINNGISNVLPIGAHLVPFPSLPFIVLVGVQVVGTHDCDDNENWGAWQTGIAGDNASTGQWENNVPIGSQTVDVSPGTIVQPFNQVTPGGEYCFVTENAPSLSSSIGEADVDAGHTTLQSSIIDMSGYQEPIVSYYRWYTNNPPGGANPGADYWQVRMSNNGGQSWVYIENTKTSDARWRRNAFRVSDYLEPTNQMRFRFIASDSIRPGENLEGGSLVEAALDDFILYDGTFVSVDEKNDPQHNLVVWPNPIVGNELELSFAMANNGSVTVRVYAENGQLVHTQNLGQQPSGVVRRRVTLPELAAGSYMLEVSGSEVLATRILVR